ncbi:MAG: prepilin-type N-terminal cleavage/methylation domain-containing protein [Sedimentisphaerales bacterium]|nr:prepilin-type N-terminal cleavage/methylation domain-containing protein [Sedimentisphaerales bacterium]
MVLKRIKNSSGLTLIEAMAAMAVLAVAALGTLGYQYHSAKHGRTAKLEMTATRTAQLILEDWKSKGGDANYDPSSLGLGFVKDEEMDFYKIEIDELPIFVKLLYNDVAHDAVAGVTLREISVIVRWRRDFTAIEPELNDPHLVLTTYVRLDASGG